MNARLAKLLDEQEVRDACMAYWAGWDRRDLTILLRAFTPTATLCLFGGEQVLKVSDIAASGRIDGLHEHTSHALSNQVVTVAGDAATADSLVTAHLVGAEGKVMVRGLRYLDDLVRTDEGWRIERRQHFVLWQYDASRVEPWQ
jgi:hypothetical protein